MTPSFPTSDITDGRGCHIELATECRDNAARTNGVSDMPNVSIRQFVVIALDAGFVSPLQSHVSTVFESCSKKQVIRVDAQSVVADVANQHSWRNRPSVHQKAEAVSNHSGDAIAVYPDAAVASAIPVTDSAAGPNPASLGLIYVLPEADFWLFSDASGHSVYLGNHLTNSRMVH